MRTPAYSRTLTIHRGGVTISGGRRPITAPRVVVNWSGSRTIRSNRVLAEATLKWMADRLWDRGRRTWRGSVRPWDIAVTIVVAREVSTGRFDFHGMRRHGFRVNIQDPGLGKRY